MDIHSAHAIKHATMKHVLAMHRHTKHTAIDIHVNAILVTTVHVHAMVQHTTFHVLVTDRDMIPIVIAMEEAHTYAIVIQQAAIL